MPVVDHAAVLAELLTLVDERFQEAIRAGIADIGRLDKVERMRLDVFVVERGYVAASFGGQESRAVTARAAIDGVSE